MIDQPFQPFQPFGAGLLTRVSTLAQTEGMSLGNQSEAGRLAAVRLGIPVVEVYEDAGVSGNLYEARPALQRALSDLRAAKFNVLIVYEWSRATWNLSNQSRLVKEISEAGGRIYIVAEGRFVDPEDYHQEFSSSMLVAAARLYRKHLRAESVRNKRNAAENGRQPSRTMRPYGYRIVTKADVLRGTDAPETLGQYIAIEEEAVHVRRAFELYAAGFSLRATCLEMDRARAVPIRGGKRWAANTLQGMLQNPVYKGEAKYGAQRRIVDETRTGRISAATGKAYTSIVYMAQSPGTAITIPCPALVDAATWQTAQDRLAENRTALAGNPGRRYLLTGFVYCPRCGKKMRSQCAVAKGNVPARFRCRDYADRASHSSGNGICNRTAYDMSVVERLAMQAVQGVATRPEVLIEALVAWHGARAQSAAQSPAIHLERERERLQGVLAQAERRRAALIASAHEIDTETLTASLRQLGEMAADTRAALAEMRGAQNAPVEMDAMDAMVETVETVSRYFVRAEPILLNDALPLPDRIRVLRGLVDRIEMEESDMCGGQNRPPQPGGVRVLLRPLFHGDATGENRDIVPCMWIHCTVSGTFEIITGESFPVSGAVTTVSPAAPESEVIA